MSVQFTTQTVRELKGAPLSVYLILLLTTMPVSQEWIERASGYTDKPVSQALAYLEETGRVVRTKAGWQIAAGVQLPLPGPSLQVTPSLSGNDASRNNSDSKALESELFRLKTGSLINDDDNDLKDIKDSSSLINPSEVGKIPTLKVVLQNLVVVFGDELSESDVPADTSPELALAWIGKAYQDHLNNGLTNPLGLIRSRLKSKTARKFHLDYLPDRYLEVIGLWRENCPLCGLELHSRESLNEHLLQPHDTDDESALHVQPVLDASLDVLLDGVGISINQAWEQMLSRVQADMARASFDTWVRDTRPYRWDDSNSQITIGARNAYARDWLSDKFAESAQEILSSLLSRPITVRFVTVSVETEG